MTTYRERLSAPASWWVAALAFGVVWGWIMLVASTWPIAIVTAIAVAALGFDDQHDAHQLAEGGSEGLL